MKDIDIKDILRKIHERQMNPLYSAKEFFQDDLPKKQRKFDLPKRHRGLYWIWSNLDLGKLGDMRQREPSKNEIPFSELISQRRDLNCTCEIHHNKYPGFIIRYNGIGGHGKTTPTAARFGLRERIEQGFNSTHKKTGALKLKSRTGYDEKNWAVSYFNFDDDKNWEIIKPLADNPDKDDPSDPEVIKLIYSNYANALELCWRIYYGTPILTRK